MDVVNKLHSLKQGIWKRRRGIALGLVILTVLYGLLSAALFVAMRQGPLRFAAIMSKVPMVSMIVLPFEPLWNIARGGDLKIGDPAPDFRLKTYQRSSWVQLSNFRGDRPVVLIFGSYT